MKLKALLRGIPVSEVKGPKDVEITGLSINSKVIAPGNLFIALRGKDYDGADFVPEAIAGGAAAILVDMYNPFLKKGIAQIIVPDTRAILGALAGKFYHTPSSKLFMMGVTGTNGKTTTTFLIRHLFEQKKVSTGLLGTILYSVGDYQCSASRTTPDVVTTHKLLGDMVHQGCKAAVMEVSSHALAQKRVASVHFDLAIFTNLSAEHIDYHGSMDAYAQAKSLLFYNPSDKSPDQPSPLKWAILNADEKWNPSVHPKTNVLTYGFSKKADIRAEIVDESAEGSCFKVSYKGETCRVKWGLIGRFNISNALAAIGAAVLYGISFQDACHFMENAPSVPGRLERVPNERGVHVFVDYAHTDAALEQVLLCLRRVAKKQLRVLFGCGGNRDQDKRPRMARAAERYADDIVITSDNPRMEDPESILDDIEKGFKKDTHHRIARRKEAIAHILQKAEEGDVVLLAGKGHEKQQVRGHQSIPFDDVAVAKEVLEQVCL